MLDGHQLASIAPVPLLHFPEDKSNTDSGYYLLIKGLLDA